MPSFTLQRGSNTSSLAPSSSQEQNIALTKDFSMSPSYHNAYTQAKLVGSLLKLEQFSVFSELTLRIVDKDYKPDICLYSNFKRPVNLSLPDVYKMTEMPLLAIELLSPEHTIQDVLARFYIYFESNVKSCWLVIPVAAAVIVYTSLQQAQRFTSGDVFDKQLNISVSLDDIFD